MDEQDEQLQMALALSLQEYNQFSPSVGGPSNHLPRTATGNNVTSPRAATGNTPASGSGAPAAKPTQKRGKKLPQFAPSEAEIDACFKELASNGRSHITVVDIMETGTKLGLELDHQKVRAMLEYLGEKNLGSINAARGAISLQDFKEIAKYFRVE